MKKLILVMTMIFGMVSLASAFTISEEMNEWGNLNFTVNNEYNDIVEFVVGNDNAYSAEFLDNPEQALNRAYIVKKVNYGGGSEWVVANYRWGDVIRDVSWLSDVEGFDDYDYGFLFTSWYFDNSREDGKEFYGDYLEIGVTTGYSGCTDNPQSPFAAIRSDNSIIFGEASAVPIPGAVWLLGSSLVGMMVIRKRK